MLFAALRDMQWRRRRLVIAIVSTGLVFALTLVLTGLSNGFRVEAEQTVNSMGVDGFVVQAGAPGPFLGATAFSETVVGQVAAEPGVTAAAPLAFAATSIKQGASTRTVSAFGAPERGPGMPAVSQGRAPATPEEVAASSTLGRHVGDDLALGVHTFRIVGIVAESTTIGKAPNMFLTTEGLQRLSYNGAPMVTSIGFKGTPRALPDGYQALGPTAGVNDLMRPLKVAVQGITIMSYLLWVVAALIVGSVVYLSALERVRDFAVFKAIGVPTRAILAVPLIAVAIGLLASVAGLRRAVAVDPALAFGGP